MLATNVLAIRRNRPLEITISLPSGTDQVALTGSGERNLKLLRGALGVNISARDGQVKISGESRSVGQAAHVLEQLTNAARRKQFLEREDLLDLIASVSRAPVADFGDEDKVKRDRELDQGMDVYLPGRKIHAKTPGQKAYIRAIDKYDLTFCIGPAGTGKTYLAVAAAVAMLKRGQFRKLVLVRPAVEAGEKLGFLPGSMQDKVNPYLRPLLDALHDMMDFEQVQRFIAADIIEIIPLAFMRGRTLNESMVICDEAQNTTRQQMLMLLTRLGQGSKMVITGDTSQIDLEDPRTSGLIDAARRLRRVEDIQFVGLGQGDIVRHSLVQRIIEAYDPNADKRPQAPEVVQAVEHAHPEEAPVEDV